MRLVLSYLAERVDLLGPWRNVHFSKARNPSLGFFVGGSDPASRDPLASNIALRASLSGLVPEPYTDSWEERPPFDDVGAGGVPVGGWWGPESVDGPEKADESDLRLRSALAALIRSSNDMGRGIGSGAAGEEVAVDGGARSERASLLDSTLAEVDLGAWDSAFLRALRSALAAASFCSIVIGVSGAERLGFVVGISTLAGAAGAAGAGSGGAARVGPGEEEDAGG